MDERTILSAQLNTLLDELMTTSSLIEASLEEGVFEENEREEMMLLSLGCRRFAHNTMTKFSIGSES